jgi:hypothetical protein
MASLKPIAAILAIIVYNILHGGVIYFALLSLAIKSITFSSYVWIAFWYLTSWHSYHFAPTIKVLKIAMSIYWTCYFSFFISMFLAIHKKDYDVDFWHFNTTLIYFIGCNLLVWYLDMSANGLPTLRRLVLWVKGYHQGQALED